MLDYIKTYGDFVARENVCLNSTTVVVPLSTDACPTVSRALSHCFIVFHEVTASHEHLPREESWHLGSVVPTLPSC